MAGGDVQSLVIQLRAQGIKVTEAQLRKLGKQSDKTGMSLKGMIASVGGIYALGRAFSSVVSIGSEFASSQSNLAAILGTTRGQLGSLNTSARELGASTKFTASQVVQLQTEFAKLGFSTKEIENAQASTLALAGATGVDLAVAAEQAGQMVNAFGLGAEQTDRVVNVMAASFSSSALDMEKFSNSMTYVSAVANQSGISIEATTGILGKLADVGIDGSIAGTALRRIFLEMGNEASKLSQKVGFAVQSEEDLFRALKQLNAEGLTTAEMEDLVGKRAISAFSNMLTFADGAEKLTGEITDTNAAMKMQEEQLDNLQGDLDILKSASADVAITLFEEFEPVLRSVVRLLTDFMGSLDMQTLKSYATSIGIVTTAWGAYTLAQKAATMSVKTFKATLVKTGIGALVVGLGYAIDKLNIFGDSSEETDEVASDLSKTITDSLTPAMRELVTSAAEIDTVESLEGAIESLESTYQEQHKAHKQRVKENLEGQIEASLNREERNRLENEYYQKLVPEQQKLIDMKGEIEALETRLQELLESRAKVNNQLTKQEEQLAGVGSAKYKQLLKDLDNFVTINKEKTFQSNLEELQGQRDHFLKIVELYGFSKEKENEIREAYDQREADLRAEELDKLQQYFDAHNEITFERRNQELLEEVNHQKAIAMATITNKDEMLKAIEKLDKIYLKKKGELDAQEKKMNEDKVYASIKTYQDLGMAVAGYFKVTGKNVELTANLQYASALVDTYRAATAALATGGGFPAGIPLMLTTIVQGLTQVAQIAKARDSARATASQSIPTAEYGANFITSGPQALLVGDNPGGREQVSVTPLSSPDMRGGGAGASPIQINVSGNVMSKEFVEDELIETLNEAIRQGNIIA